MKFMAVLGGSGIVTSALAGGEVGLVLGNLALLAAAGALVLGTVNIERARR
jgi:hypothetical protein